MRYTRIVAIGVRRSAGIVCLGLLGLAACGRPPGAMPTVPVPDPAALTDAISMADTPRLRRTAQRVLDELVTDVVRGFERTHPFPHVRAPVITGTAEVWRASGGHLPVL